MFGVLRKLAIGLLFLAATGPKLFADESESKNGIFEAVKIAPRLQLYETDGIVQTLFGEDRESEGFEIEKAIPEVRRWINSYQELGTKAIKQEQKIERLKQRISDMRAKLFQLRTSKETIPAEFRVDTVSISRPGRARPSFRSLEELEEGIENQRTNLKQAKRALAYFNIDRAILYWRLNKLKMAFAISEFAPGLEPWKPLTAEKDSAPKEKSLDEQLVEIKTRVDELMTSKTPEVQQLTPSQKYRDLILQAAVVAKTTAEVGQKLDILPVRLTKSALSYLHHLIIDRVFVWIQNKSNKYWAPVVTISVLAPLIWSGISNSWSYIEHKKAQHAAQVKAAEEAKLNASRPDQKEVETWNALVKGYHSVTDAITGRAGTNPEKEFVENFGAYAGGAYPDENIQLLYNAILREISLKHSSEITGPYAQSALGPKWALFAAQLFWYGENNLPGERLMTRPDGCEPIPGVRSRLGKRTEMAKDEQEIETALRYIPLDKLLDPDHYPNFKFNPAGVPVSPPSATQPTSQPSSAKATEGKPSTTQPAVKAPETRPTRALAPTAATTTKPAARAADCAKVLEASHSP